MDTPASLLERLRKTPDESSWRRLHDLYRPLIHRWLSRDRWLGEDAEDITQEVLGVLLRELPKFQRQRNGSFRNWLRIVTVHRLLAWKRARRSRAQAFATGPEPYPLEQLNDPTSELSRLWDEEHDRHVLRRLLELIEPSFEESTLAAFRRVVLDGCRPIEAARELGLSINAVLLAKSRVLHRLRQEARGLVE